MALFGPQAQQALLLSTLAGLSTGIGGAMAIIRKPDNQLLAALLGVAIGVMITLSMAEMFVRNAIQHGWLGITAAVVCGALTYCVLQPYFPDFDSPSTRRTSHSPGQGSHSKTAGKAGSSIDPSAADVSAESGAAPRDQPRTAELLRLGLLMALTMTLHNMPEGFAVAFSSFTDFGPYMAMAIAIHNIPEGVIVAAPVYAATGSRWKAMGTALASGLSEPIGALLALVAVKPFITEEPLHYILAFVGGIMTAVCVVELWPEARKCRADARLFQGIALGTLVMAGTLAIGV